MKRKVNQKVCNYCSYFLHESFAKELPRCLRIFSEHLLAPGWQRRTFEWLLQLWSCQIQVMCILQNPRRTARTLFSAPAKERHTFYWIHKERWNAFAWRIALQVYMCILRDALCTGLLQRCYCAEESCRGVVQFQITLVPLVLSMRVKMH